MVKLTGRGRIYTDALNILDMDTLLDISGANTNTSFFHLNGLTMDGGARDYYLLKNVDSGNGLTHVRMTNCRFVNTDNPHVVTTIDIERTKSEAQSPARPSLSSLRAAPTRRAALCERAEIVIHEQRADCSQDRSFCPNLAKQEPRTRR